MMHYDENERCTKCGSDDINNVWRPKVKDSWDRGYSDREKPVAEHIERRCRRCKYFWFVKPIKAVKQTSPHSNGEPE